MTKVELIRKNGRLLGYVLRGHAGFSTHGKDIVCSALSMLAITCCNALEKIAEIVPFVEQKEAYLRVEISEAQRKPEADTILKLFELGALDIAKEYPDHVKIID